MPLMTGKELNKEFIHYGHYNFYKTLFNPVINIDGFVKPEGGLWGSPIDDEWSWKEWCELEDFHKTDFDVYFKFRLTDDANVFVLDGNDVEEIKKIPALIDYPDDIDMNNYCVPLYHINFEEAAKEYDAIYLACEPKYHWLLYGWDCNSILVMNPDVVDCFQSTCFCPTGKGMMTYNPKEGVKRLKELLDASLDNMSKEDLQALNDFYFKIVEYSDKYKGLQDIHEQFKDYCKMKIKHRTMFAEYLNDPKLKEDAMRDIDESNYMLNKPILAFTAEELKNRIKNKKDDKLVNRYGNNSVFNSWMTKNHKS